MKVHVPPSAGLGDRHIERSLKTSNRAEALRRHPIVLGEIKAEIERLRRAPDGSLKPRGFEPPQQPAEWAQWWREQVFKSGGNPDTGDVPLGLEAALDEEIEKRLGRPIGVERDVDGDDAPVYPDHAERAAQELYGLAVGNLVPPDAPLERYITERRLKTRYADRSRRAVRRLKAWMSARNSGRADVRTLTRHSAALFVDDLCTSEISTITVNSYVSALATYWSWMERRGLTKSNPWSGQQREPGDDEGAEVRAFTDAEAATLLGGNTSQTLHDLMRIAALSGMRISEICRLTIGDTSDDIFNVLDSKTKAGIRRVPVHSALRTLVARRSAGKAPSDFLIEELKSPPSRSKERSAKASERFTAYRRRLGVDERAEGQRVSNVNFHSWRHWFITRALQADLAPHLVGAVAGHEQYRTTMTLKVYDSGPSVEQLRSVVEAVVLPPGAPLESPHGPKIGEGNRKRTILPAA